MQKRFFNTVCHFRTDSPFICCGLGHSNGPINSNGSGYLCEKNCKNKCLNRLQVKKM